MILFVDGFQDSVIMVNDLFVLTLLSYSMYVNSLSYVAHILY